MPQCLAMNTDAMQNIVDTSVAVVRSWRLSSATASELLMLLDKAANRTVLSEVRMSFYYASIDANGCSSRVLASSAGTIVGCRSATSLTARMHDSSRSCFATKGDVMPEGCEN